MGSADTETNILNNTDEQDLIAQLPEELQSFCASGKSVMELAHLVKNIIQMVSGSVEILELGLERKQYDRVRRSWDIFEPNFMRLKKFVMDLIKYTKQYPLQQTECDFNEIVQKGIHSCEHFLKNKQVKLQLRQDNTIPIVRCDAERLEEMVGNLVIHALDNLKDQMGEISIQTHYLPENHQVHLVVGDNGPALSKEAQLQLMEPFERTRNMCGTGFDIPLAKLYVEQHDGYMEIDANETLGNHVCVYLPVK
ncbi:MAG: HAMP domain-containing histidine kinase [Planctomycetes bacterium]|nr:HAMP domain-containing histidine kinase [Planctomycetota bacterium]